MRQVHPHVLPSVPASMIWGTEDRLITMRQAGIISKWLGKPDCVTVEGAGHLPQLEQPARRIYRGYKEDSGKRGVVRLGVVNSLRRR